MCVQKQPFRGALQESCSANMKQTHRRTTVCKCNLNKANLQLYWNHTMHWYTPKTSQEKKEHIWRNACVCHKSFKRLCFKKLLITVFKTNLLICNKNNNKNNKCPVIEPSTFRKVLRFFYWALLFWQ